jgi:hypothetical protein
MRQLCLIEEESSMPMLSLSVKIFTCVGVVGQKEMFGIGQGAERVCKMGI